MRDMADAILDAAERRIRQGGFSGFSFREIAADVGVKSSSVHYHFPTKEALTAAVVHRYTDRVAAFVKEETAAGKAPVAVWTGIFRGCLQAGDGMCVGGILGADDRPRFREYVVRERRPSYAYQGDVRTGVILPDAGVEYYDVPSEYRVPAGYRYTVVNGRPVLIESRTRRVVEVFE